MALFLAHRNQIANTQAHCDFDCQDTSNLQPRSGFSENTRKERGLFSTLPEHNSLRPGRINGGGSAFNPATKPRHRLVLSWSRPRTGFDISITRFGIEATSNSMPPASPSLHPGRFDVLSSSVVEERRGWEARWCRRRGPINQSGRETRGVEGWFGGEGGLRGRRAGEKRESGRRAGASQGL